MTRLLPLLLLAACAAPPAGWRVLGPPEVDRAAVQDYVEAAIAVTGDPGGGLADGGVIDFRGPSIDGFCPAPAGMHVSGCAYYRSLLVLWAPPRFGPDLKTTALAHELCHVGAGASEDQAGACALLVEQQVLLR